MLALKASMIIKGKQKFIDEIYSGLHWVLIINGNNAIGQR